MYLKKASWLVCSIVFAANIYGQSAYAGIVYSYAFDQSNYSVAAGGDVTVKLLLRETFNAGDITLLDTDGILSVSARVAYAGAGGAVEPAQIFNVMGNAAFDGSIVVDIDPGLSGGIAEYVDFISPSVKVVRGNSFNELLIGSFFFHAGGVAGEVTALHAIDFSADIETATGDPSFLFLDDPLNPRILESTATITVNGTLVQAVPEPSSFLLALLIIPMGFVVRRQTKICPV